MWIKTSEELEKLRSVIGDEAIAEGRKLLPSYDLCLLQSAQELRKSNLDEEEITVAEGRFKEGAKLVGIRRPRQALVQTMFWESKENNARFLIVYWKTDEERGPFRWTNHGSIH